MNIMTDNRGRRTFHIYRSNLNSELYRRCLLRSLNVGISSVMSSKAEYLDSASYSVDFDIHLIQILKVS
jgi:hypothetical protein